MLKTFLASLFVLLTTSSILVAEEDVQLLVIVADQSNSMEFYNWLEPQRDVLVEYFSAFEPKCNTLIVVYLGWGGGVNVVRQGVIRNHNDAFAFASLLVQPAAEMDGSTNQRLAVEHAVAILNTYAAPRTMIFTTDEFALSNSGYGLATLLPPLTTVFGVALGNSSVEQYVKEQIVPSTGQTYLVKSPKELRSKLFDVLDSAIVNSCIA